MEVTGRILFGDGGREMPFRRKERDRIRVVVLLGMVSEGEGGGADRHHPDIFLFLTSRPFLVES